MPSRRLGTKGISRGFMALLNLAMMNILTTNTTNSDNTANTPMTNLFDLITNLPCETYAIPTLMADLLQLLLPHTATCYNHPGHPTCSRYWYWTPPQPSRTSYVSTEILQSHLQHTILHSKDLLKVP